MEPIGKLNLENRTLIYTVCISNFILIEYIFSYCTRWDCTIFINHGIIAIILILPKKNKKLPPLFSFLVISIQPVSLEQLMAINKNKKIVFFINFQFTISIPRIKIYSLNLFLNDFL